MGLQASGFAVCPQLEAMQIQVMIKIIRYHDNTTRLLLTIIWLLKERLQVPINTTIPSSQSPSSLFGFSKPQRKY